MGGIYCHEGSLKRQHIIKNKNSKLNCSLRTNPPSPRPRTQMALWCPAVFQFSLRWKRLIDSSRTRQMKPHDLASQLFTAWIINTEAQWKQTVRRSLITLSGNQKLIRLSHCCYWRQLSHLRHKWEGRLDKHITSVTQIKIHKWNTNKTKHVYTDLSKQNTRVNLEKTIQSYTQATSYMSLFYTIRTKRARTLNIVSREVSFLALNDGSV
jgi:hypothetical protein